MKLAIATPEQATSEWTPFLTEWLTPAEIRLKFHALVLQERAMQEAGEFDDDTELWIVSMNRTVLDLVTSEHAKNVGHMTYEDVFVWKEGQGVLGGLVPLLELHDDAWLGHSSLGDIFECCLL